MIATIEKMIDDSIEKKFQDFDSYIMKTLDKAIDKHVKEMFSEAKNEMNKYERMTESEIPSWKDI